MAKDREIHWQDDFELPEDWEPDSEVRFPLEDTDKLQESIEVAAIVTRWIGGAVTIGNIRRQIGPNAYVPGEWVWAWNSFFPTISMEDQQAQQLRAKPNGQPEEVAEPEEAKAA